MNLEYCTITAPLDGYTGKLTVQPGNLVRAADPLVVINQITPIYVNFAVPQQHLGDIKKYMARRAGYAWQRLCRTTMARRRWGICRS